MTKIEWTHPPGFKGESWNPVTGCTKVSDGCKNCYAERDFPRAYGNTGRKFTDVALHSDRLDRPLRRKTPICYFVNSMSDLFHADVPDEFIARVWNVMAHAPRHRFIVLTKRPERMCAWLSSVVKWRGEPSIWMARDPLDLIVGYQWPLPNVWLGVSVEDQPAADERITLLLRTQAAVRLVSYEPALGPVDFRQWTFAEHARRAIGAHPGISWIIVGGESGPKARPFEVQWARDTVRQCRDARVACFVKQVGARPVHVGRWEPTPIGYERVEEDGCAHRHYVYLRDRKGGDPSEWPEDLRVREWPR